MRNCKSHRAAKTGMVETNLEKISKATTLDLLKEVAFDNYAIFEFNYLHALVKTALAKIDSQISFDLMLKFRRRPNDNYHTILEEDGFTFTNEVIRGIIADDLHTISRMDMVYRAIQDLSRKNEITAAISQLHRDKQPDNQSAFTRLPVQEFANTFRYEAQRSTGQVEEVFMLKCAGKTPVIVQGCDKRREHWNSASFVIEFLTSTLYKRVLYKRAPVIALVKATAPNEILLRSKYLNGFENASKYTGGTGYNQYGKTKSLATVSGGGKLMAVLLAFGEHDDHAGNIGVMTDWDARQDKISEIFAKIDHGWSATQLFTNGECMWKNFHSACNIYQYKDNVKIDLTEFRESLEQILMITPEEIADHLKARVYELEQMGFDPRGLLFPEWTDNSDHNHDDSPAQTFMYDSLALLEGHYIERFQKHWEALRQFKIYVEATEKMTKRGREPATDWVKSEWIKYLNGANPIRYAYDNKLIIDGKDPILYALEKGLSIDGQDLVTYSTFHRINIGAITVVNYAIANGILIGGMNPKVYVNMGDMDPIVFAHLRGFAIHNKSALEHAAAYAIKIGGFDPIEYAFIKDWQINNKHPLEYAVLNGIKIKGHDPIVYARRKNRKFGTKEPIEYAAINNLKIKRLDPIVYAVGEKISIDNKSPLEYAAINGIKIEGTDPIAYAQHKGWLIDNKSPLEYAVINSIKIMGMDPIMCAHKHSVQIAGLTPIAYAVKNGINIGGILPKKYEQIGNQDPIIYAHKQHLLIENIKPVAYAVLHSIKIEGQDPNLYAREKGIAIDSPLNTTSSAITSVPAVALSHAPSENKVSLPSDQKTPTTYRPQPRVRSESCPFEYAISLREIRRLRALNPHATEETKTPHPLPPRYPRSFQAHGRYTASLSQQEHTATHTTTGHSARLTRSEATTQQQRVI